MTLDQLLDYCLAKPGAWPDQPFGDATVVKVAELVEAAWVDSRRGAPGRSRRLL